MDRGAVWSAMDNAVVASESPFRIFQLQLLKLSHVQRLWHCVEKYMSKGGQRRALVLLGFQASGYVAKHIANGKLELQKPLSLADLNHPVWAQLCEGQSAYGGSTISLDALRYLQDKAQQHTVL
jgi:hypothetical protein